MLILSRETQEAVVIDLDDRLQGVLKVTVLEIQGKRVKLGFEADVDIAVHREEVWERIRAAAGETC